MEQKIDENLLQLIDLQRSGLSKREIQIASSFIHILAMLALALILMDILVQAIRFGLGIPTAKGIVPLFDVSSEANIPTFFSAFMMGLSSLLLGLISRLEKRESKYWAWFALGLFLMSLDEVVQFHERLSEPTAQLLGEGKLGIFYHSWIIPGLAVVLFLIFFFWKFFARLPAKPRSRILGAGTVFLAGSLGVEAIGGMYFEGMGNDWTYNMIAANEEALELAGLLLLVRALLLFLAEHHPQVQFNFTELR